MISAQESKSLPRCSLLYFFYYCNRIIQLQYVMNFYIFTEKIKQLDQLNVQLIYGDKFLSVKSTEKMLS